MHTNCHPVKRNSPLTMVLIIFIFQTGLLAQNKADRIDSLIQKYHEFGQFNGSVLVAENGKVILKKGYGLANMEWNIPNAADTKFRLGSITKQFTSMLIMQLVEKQKIKLDAPITDYIPDYRKDSGNKITVFHLLTHTSGLPNYTSFPGFMRDKSRDPCTIETFIKEYGSRDLEFEPGTKYAYTNTGYYLLGAIIEKVTDQTYETVLKENILDPLGMKNTGYDHHGTILSKRAAGYQKVSREYAHANYLDMSLPYAAGALYSTVEDLYIWDQALYTNRLLSKKHMKEMFTPFLGNYAFGWTVLKIGMGESADSVLCIRHSGGINGFSTYIKRYVDDKHLIVALDNTQSNSLGTMTDGIANILYDQPYDLPLKSLSDTLLRVIEKQDVMSAIQTYHALQKKNAETYDFSEDELNTVGYQLLLINKTDDAIEIFKLNLEMFPESANAYDSLAEAYKEKGENDLAIQNYARSLELNPRNTNAINMMKEMIEKK